MSDIKGRVFCLAKEMVNRVKKQLTNWQRIFAGHTSVNGLNEKYEKNCNSSVT
jgi:hypothetical protein